MAAPAVSAGGPLPKANGHQTFTTTLTTPCPGGTWDVSLNVKEMNDGTFKGFFKWTEGDPAVSYSWELVPNSANFYEGTEYDQVWFNVVYQPNGSTLAVSYECLYNRAFGAGAMQAGHLFTVAANDYNQPGGVGDTIDFGPLTDDGVTWMVWGGTHSGNVNVMP